MSKREKSGGLSRRERQIMDALYRLGKGSAADIRESLEAPPTYTAVRTHLAILQEKGHVKFESDGTRYIYEPVVPRNEMAKSVMDGVLQTFFGGSVERVVATLIDSEEAAVTQEQLDRLAEIIEQARREGR
ncbi:MAG: BlaI/MecI/CopY family transcriptional regulator [Fimbriimonas sp.]|nr:BlaI/MecI/CopY family transcriptional regulator [Fimbriimonas sp.]